MSFIVGVLALIGLSLTDAGINLTLGGWDPKPSWLTQFNSEWLHSHAYIPNILAAITGFLIGAPVALVVLATFVSEREERAVVDRVTQMTNLSWQAFRVAVLKFCNDNRIKALSDDLDILYNAHIDAYGKVGDYIAFRNGTVTHGNLGRTETQLHEAIKDSVQPFAQAQEAVLKGLGTNRELEIAWSEVRGSWSTLDQFIRIQRLERGLPWFDPSFDAELRTFMARTGNPLSGISQKIEMTPSWNPPISSGDALDMLEHYASTDKYGLRAAFELDNDNVFGYKSAADQAVHANPALELLHDLRYCVDQIDGENWPHLI
ncbi:hypothetical protein O6072_02445 [Mycolicibacterium neoaurum]|uniref:hypothetical protein n=1 Tax=Mycolicibacterium neoaurum TaxID=1795 RepID=UPI00248C9FBE|nr:hypothetical protein [Mycolicibacterium neoaurum]WBS08760.1 hypothetical protein O6072_02445 [Mycolicibacterium neoaurum]